MLTFFKGLLDFNEKQLQRYRKTLEQVNALEDKARDLKDSDFPEETKKLQEQIRSEEKTLEEVLPWSFALVREAARRSTGLRHYDVQLMGGMALNEGKIIEQKTGEGKTLTATAALYVNALSGKGSHLVTVNDYLARRDAGWMGAIFNFLGMTTAAMISEQSFIYDEDYVDKESADFRLYHLKPCSRKEAYDADITYGINSEFGFDYLRDNMSQAPENLVQRGFNFAIVDEADSVLIDEARTPHIISAPYDDDVSKYYTYAKVIHQLNPATDFVIDEKLKTSHLSDEGIAHVEKIMGVNNIYEDDYDSLFHIEAALKAEALFKNDKDYIVKDGEVIIVDEFTGRLLQGRRFSEGLHQAIEAKEGVAIKQESRTLATVSLQNYFRMYAKLGGMTGTAATEAEEFSKIYKAEVVVMPTHRNIQRKDQADVIYKTIKAKYEAVARDVAEQHKAGRPVLIGTTSIDKNEYLADLLKKNGVPHELLNAKNHEREAQIIARAGEKGAVTVATNMAGRGVDIILGGMQPSETEYDDHAKFEKDNAEWQKKHDEVVSLGGLYVIGTERHESRRIDNQLRGRSGRQGDPGESLFFVSLEDDLMRIFGGEQISKLMTFFNLPEDQPLSHQMVSRAIEQAQVKVEGFNFDIRKHLVEYDDVLNKQRDIIYDWRRDILFKPLTGEDSFKNVVLQSFRDVITQLTASYFAIKETAEEDPDNQLVKDFEVLFPQHIDSLKGLLKEKKHTEDEVITLLMAAAQKMYEDQETLLGEEMWSQVARGMFLNTVDQYWTKHLTAIDDLREGINLRGYAQMDPLVEYKNEAFRLFESLMGEINFDFTRRILHIEVRPYAQQEQPADGTPPAEPQKPQLKAPKQKEQKLVFKAAASKSAYSGQKAEDAPPADDPVIKSHKNLGRNDPCWCGSGKKYKKCHYPN